MKIILSLYFLTLSLYSQGNLHPKIQLKNVGKETLSKIQAQAPDVFNSLPTFHQTDKLIEILYQTGEYQNIIISQEDGFIIIEGVPHQNISTIEIRGNKNLSNREILSVTELKQGAKFKFQELVNAAEKIKETYGKEGFLNAQVDIAPVTSSGKIIIRIDIKENSPTIINQVTVNSEFENIASEIKKRLNTEKRKPKLTEANTVKIEEQIRTYLKESKILNANLQGPLLQFNSDKTKAEVVYSIINPQKFIFFFEGNKYLSNTELINALDLDKYNQISSNPAAEFTSKIEALYFNFGFANVNIKYNEIDQGKTLGRKIYFTINEGERVFLREVQFNGRFSKNQKFYQNLFKEIYAQNTYKQQKMKDALDTILQRLQDTGFLKARILSTQTSFSSDKTGAYIQVYMDEGPQTIVDKIQIKGNEAFSSEQIKSVINIIENQPLNLSILESAGERITKFYRERGYLDFELKTRLNNIITYSKDNTKASLFFEIYEGPVIIASKIIIEGNGLTKNYVILNEIEFEEGDILTPQKIEDSEFHLQKTGLFSSVDILTLEKGSNVSSRTVIIKVQERNPGIVSFGVGANTEFDLTLRTYADIRYNNIAGTARAVQLRGEVKRITDIDFIDHNVILSYLEPTLFAKRTRGRIALIRAREVFTRNPETKILDSNTANFSFEKDFSRYFKLTWNLWSISSNKVFLFSDKTTEEDVDIATIGPTLEWDRRNHPFVTTKGFFAKVSAEFSDDNLGSSDTVHFTRYDSRLNVYRPTRLWDIVWASSLRGGYIKNFKNQNTTSIPEVKEFKLGGRDTIRGFEPNEIPNDTDIAGNEIQVNTESYYYLLNTEFRIPIFGSFETVLFYDGGSVMVRGFQMADDYRDSAGIGFRYQTPVGPLSVEYGHKLDRNKALDESAGRFHLSFGTF